MYNLLKGKRGIIFGALNEQSIAWHVAEKVFEEGGRFTLTNTPIALRMGEINKLAEKCNSLVISADATNINDLENVFLKSIDFLDGKIDFILHAVAMSPNVRKAYPYDDLNYDYFIKTLDVSALSFHKLLQVAKKLDAINEWGSVIALSYIAAQRTLCEYNDMAEAKSALESIARSFGYVYGKAKNVRVNTISQSPTPTLAAEVVKEFKDLHEYAEKMSPLGNASARDCADYCVTLFSDLTRKVTMQNLYLDGGFSRMTVSSDIMTMVNHQSDAI